MLWRILVGFCISNLEVWVVEMAKCGYGGLLFLHLHAGAVSAPSWLRGRGGAEPTNFSVNKSFYKSRLTFISTGWTDDAFSV